MGCFCGCISLGPHVLASSRAHPSLLHAACVVGNLRQEGSQRGQSLHQTPTSWRDFRRAGLSMGERCGGWWIPPFSLKSPRQETIHQQGKLRWLKSSLRPRFQSQPSGVIGGLGSGGHTGERWADAEEKSRQLSAGDKHENRRPCPVADAPLGFPGQDLLGPVTNSAPTPAAVPGA